ncbi:MAG: DUF324 domain-containing protein [Candidatus Ozemobacter sibiricus]|uniref:DUF324 domain-containing protein n=1 Tax=Candidatus Ozemobacter sibiricus TaxID=2268124 RepID=A0A367ZJD4_9BACT|nr:MAG: DUF324 domain-containing protein [Candidatus Ozemobacter sibiricus]
MPNENTYPNNPYHFVPLPERGVKRQPAPPHDRFQHLSGSLVVRLRTLSPVFIGKGGEQGQDREHQQLLTSAGRPVIPGSSLKGMIRSTFEAVTESCLRLFQGSYQTRHANQRYQVPREHLPPTSSETEVRGCQDPAHLCLACQLFGMVSGGKNHLAQVAIGEARPEDGRWQPAPGFSIIPLMQPRPHHRAFYVLPPHQKIGRKFYFHGAQIQKSNHARKKTLDRVIPAGKTFRFTVTFTNLRQEALDRLVYSLLLESGMAHRLGQGKPAGLGSIRLQLAEVRLMPDPVARFQRWQVEERHLTGEALQAWVAEIYQRLEAWRKSPPLQALRAILHYPDPTSRSYPAPEWFRTHPHTPLAGLPTDLPPSLPAFEDWAEAPAHTPAPPAPGNAPHAPRASPPEELPPLEATVTFAPNTQEWQVQFQFDGKSKTAKTKDSTWLGNRLEEIKRQLDRKSSCQLKVRLQRDGNSFKILGLA